MAVDLATTLNYFGSDWAVLKAHLNERRDVKVRQLIGCRDHDESNILRGELKFIESLLVTEEAALRAARGRT